MRQPFIPKVGLPRLINIKKAEIFKIRNLGLVGHARLFFQTPAPNGADLDLQLQACLQSCKLLQRIIFFELVNPTQLRVDSTTGRLVPLVPIQSAGLRITYNQYFQHLVSLSKHGGPLSQNPELRSEPPKFERVVMLDGQIAGPRVLMQD